MAHIGYGYGSEWHLLHYLGRRRGAFSMLVESAVQGRDLQWLDHEESVESRTGLPRTREHRGLEFLGTSNAARQEWERLWPQSGNVHNWDAVGRCITFRGPSWVLAEAKAHLGELKSSCGATSEPSRAAIREALDRTRQALGVTDGQDWTQEYYQYCNRLALLQFLGTHDIDTHLVYAYFTGDRADLGAAGRDCPTSESGWRDALARQDQYVGLPDTHPIRHRIHRLFLPAYRADVAEELLRPEYPRTEAGGPSPSSQRATHHPSPALTREFDEAMMQIYIRAKSEAGYNATRFLQMLHEHGGVETAKRLMPYMSDGFTELWQRHRLDLTVEALILESRWSGLFSDAERQMARDRLRQCGEDV